MKQKISIIGAGSWGTTLAVMLAAKGLEVNLSSIFKNHNIKMRKERENRLFLKGVKFPPPLSISLFLEEALKNEIIVIAIPVKFLRSALKKFPRSKISYREKIFVSVSKGIEPKSLMRASQIIKEELSLRFVSVLSGPNIAKEVLNKIPSTAILACPDTKLGQKLQELFSNKTFRIYLHDDVIGVEIGGALKNIIAIACGISDGLGFGTNTKAALVTRGLTEITRLGQKLGAKSSTFWGISGLGDLVTTCFSPFSRNRSVGEYIGKGENINKVTKNMNMVAEGVETVKAAFKLGIKLKVDMPITREVYSVLYRDKSPQKAVEDLMSRPLKSENLA
ncbi:MAG: NAD(P)-dependent glycerol-3-phosphate dehydrogenase [Candidatus Omnitrophica bacterium]|jgi:glycerol-3-phosphate dehydrogenase (NAD(P)+)|nr:NAD(P)-dependent glycerol-3-phosphate dehydrogenase [Candidatus Omnitrophota bacterium]